jgi:hypothetical protein
MNKIKENEKAGGFRRHFVSPALSGLVRHSQQAEEEVQSEVNATPYSRLHTMDE